jgi:hypothetical protein
MAAFRTFCGFAICQQSQQADWEKTNGNKDLPAFETTPCSHLAALRAGELSWHIVLLGY